MLLGEIKVADPTQQEGTTQQKLQAMYEYMQQLNKQIRFVLQNIDEENLSPAFQQALEDLKTDNSVVSTVTKGDLETVIRQTADMIEMKADAVYTDPDTGQKIDLWTQVVQTAQDITSKADAEYTDPDTGKKTHLWTQVFQSAEEISQKADAAYTDPDTGKTVNLTTQVIQTAQQLESKASKDDLQSAVTQTAGEISAIVEGTTPVGAVDSTKVTINQSGVAIATGGTFTVDSGNFALDGTGNLTANGAQINGELLNNGKPVLTDADIYVGTVEPQQKKAGMIWIKPVADDEGNESVQTTHTGNYTSGSRQSLRSYPVTVTLTGTPAAASTGNYAYELSIPIYFAGDVSSASVSATVGGKTFSATVSGSRYSHKTIKLSGTYSAWLGNASSLSVKISASTDNLTSERTGDGYQISMVSRAY